MNIQELAQCAPTINLTITAGDLKEFAAQLIADAQKQLGRSVTNSKGETLSVDEVSEIYGLKKSYIYSLVHNKRIPHYKAGGGRLTFFKKSEVEAFLLANRVATYEEAETRAAKYLAERGEI